MWTGVGERGKPTGSERDVWVSGMGVSEESTIVVCVGGLSDFVFR